MAELPADSAEGVFPFPRPKEILGRYGLRPKKSFGQNFLVDPSTAAKLAELAGSEPASIVEIGAGLGGLTSALVSRGHQVTAVERDRDLLPVLRELGGLAVKAGCLRLLEADAKALDLTAEFDAGFAVDVAADVPSVRPRVLMGNIPYNLTGPLLQKAITMASKLSHAVLLVQLEVAERLRAQPDSEHYGALSVFAQAAFNVRRAFVVGSGAFYPRPSVDSAVVVLRPERPPRAEETETFRGLVKAAFAQRRKTLRNAWKGFAGLDPSALSVAAERAGIALDARGETLSIDDFRRMSEQVSP